MFNELLGLMSLILTLVIGAYIVLRERKYTPIIEKANSLLSFQVDADGNTLVPEALVKVGEAVGQGAAKSIKMGLLGEASGDARLEKGMLSAMAEDMLDKHLPWLDFVSPYLGDALNVRKFIKKNPRGIIWLVQKFGPVISKELGAMQSPSSFQQPGRQEYM